MGLFSARGRLPQPAGDRSQVRLHLADIMAQLAARTGTVPAWLGGAARAVTRKARWELTVGGRQARRVAIAATNDARIVAVLLLLAAVALGLEMAASFHVI
jgi:hypothetical protein